MTFSLFNLQERGPIFIEPQTEVYEGMIVGEHLKGSDLVVNVIQGKKLTNVRAAGKDENLILIPPIRMIRLRDRSCRTRLSLTISRTNCAIR